MLLLLAAGGVTEVGTGAAYIVDVALELGVVGEELGLGKHRVDTAGGDHAALMEGQSAEVTAAKAPAIMGDGEADFLNGGDAAVIHGVYLTDEGQVVDFIQALPVHGALRGIAHHVAALAQLQNGLAANGVMLAVLHTGGAGVGNLIGAHILIGGTVHVVVVALFSIGGQESRAAHIGDTLHRLFLGKAAGDLHRGLFAHAVNQQVGGGIEEDGAADIVIPVVIVGEAAEGRLQAADDDGAVGEGLTGAIGVDDGGAVGTMTHLAAGTVEVAGAAALGDGVVSHHGV